MTYRVILYGGEAYGDVTYGDVTNRDVTYGDNLTYRDVSYYYQKNTRSFSAS
jgi:hypothetical protein